MGKLVTTPPFFFFDGNKRTAFSAINVFWAINGFEVVVTDAESQDFILGLYGMLQATRFFPAKRLVGSSYTAFVGLSILIMGREKGFY